MLHKPKGKRPRKDGGARVELKYGRDALGAFANMIHNVTYGGRVTYDASARAHLLAYGAIERLLIATNDRVAGYVKPVSTGIDAKTGLDVRFADSDVLHDRDVDLTAVTLSLEPAFAALTETARQGIRRESFTRAVAMVAQDIERAVKAYDDSETALKELQAAGLSDDSEMVQNAARRVDANASKLKALRSEGLRIRATLDGMNEPDDDEPAMVAAFWTAVQAGANEHALSMAALDEPDDDDNDEPDDDNTGDDNDS